MENAHKRSDEYLVVIKFANITSFSVLPDTTERSKLYSLTRAQVASGRLLKKMDFPMIVGNFCGDQLVFTKLYASIA